MSAEVNALALTTVTEIAPVLSRTATLTSSAFDTIDYEGVVEVIQAAGAATAGSSPTWDGKIQDCDTSGGTYADVTGATFTQVTTTAGVQVLKLDKQKLRRFIKYVGTLGGSSTPTFPVGVIFEGTKKVR